LTKESRTTLLIMVPLVLAVGLGISCVTRSDDPKATPTPPPTATATGDVSDVKALEAELADTKAQLVAANAKLAEANAKLAGAKEEIANATLVQGRFYAVTKIVDGDTFQLGNHKVRLLGVNTPESVHPTKPVDWYGIESSNHMKKLLKGKKVRLEPEKGKTLQKAKGPFGRVLAYAFLEDGTDINRDVVRGGFGQSYHKYPCKRRAEFDELQAKAKGEGIGQWNDAGRLAWEDTHIIPVVLLADAKVIVSNSGMVHDVECDRGPKKVENGTLLETVEQAAKFRFTKLHSCLKGK
jgi:micrococcal nuclease